MFPECQFQEMTLELQLYCSEYLENAHIWNEVLRKNKIPIKAAVYTNDMYVDRDFSINLAKDIPNTKIWETDIYEHNALRSDGKKILDVLFKL